jgi:hypothetical protein
MTVFNGLPSHGLLVHFLVVMVPLTALLEIVCALWPACGEGRSCGSRWSLGCHLQGCRARR